MLPHSKLWPRPHLSCFLQQTTGCEVPPPKCPQISDAGSTPISGNRHIHSSAAYDRIACPVPMLRRDPPLTRFSPTIDAYHQHLESPPSSRGDLLLGDFWFSSPRVRQQLKPALPALFHQKSSLLSISGSEPYMPRMTVYAKEPPPIAPPNPQKMMNTHKRFKTPTKFPLNPLTQTPLKIRPNLPLHLHLLIATI